MKLSALLALIFSLLFINPLWLLATWIVTTPVVTNFINRPWQNPFFGSYRIIERFSSPAGFSIRELYNFDRIVLLLLLIFLKYRVAKYNTQYRNIDVPFILFICAILISILYSNTPVHRIRVAFDTFILCYIAYYIGKNYLFSKEPFNVFIKACLFAGVALFTISALEYFTIGRSLNQTMYRITGPFLYWENLGLATTFIMFITIFKKTIDAGKWKKFYTILIYMLGLCIFFAQTRTIMASIIIAFLFLSVTGWKIIGVKSIAKYGFIVLVIATVIAVKPSIITSTKYYQNRILARTDDGRKQLYETSVRIFKKNPIFGIGFRDFEEDKLYYISTRERIGDWISERGNLHNTYLAIAAEIGLMGLIPFLFLVFFSFDLCYKYFYSAPNNQEKLWALTMAVISLIYFLIGFTFDPLFEPTIDNKLFFLCLGITVGKYCNPEVISIQDNELSPC